MPKKEKFIIIDGNAIVHRAYHALPPLQTKDGILINSVYGFALTLIKTVKDLKPDYLAVAFDTKEPTYRHKEFKEYKAQRIKKPQELYDQIPMIKEMLAAFNIKTYTLPGYEADDLIATAVTLAAQKNKEIQTLIVTGDMDTLQLVSDKINVVAMHKGISETITYTPELVEERFNGLTVSQMIDYKALRGDPSDNIPGAKGIGEKTATDLLKGFQTVEKLYQEIKHNPDKVAKQIKPRILEILKTQEDQVLLSKKLVILDRAAPIDFSLTDCAVKAYDMDKVFELFQRWGFQSLLQKIQVSQKIANIQAEKTEATQTVLALTATDNSHYHLIKNLSEAKELVKRLKKQSELAIDTETTSINPWEAKLVGIGFCHQAGSADYLPVGLISEVKADLLKIFLDANIKKIGHNLKYDYEVLLRNDLPMDGLYFDTMISSYLLNPGTRQHNLDGLAFTELGHQMIPIENLIGAKGKNQITMDLVEPGKVAEYCGEDADFTWRLYQKFLPLLNTENIFGLFEKIEMPLVKVLAQMEQNGVCIDTELLNKMSNEVGQKIKELTKEIYKLAGQEFNVASPKQLKEVLFDHLEISTQGIGKTKTGFSTSADELYKLKNRHPIIALISEYRELAKLQSTYLEALPKLISPQDGRIHTSFNQTVTATGRLSSSEPNLQNIPIRTELGSRIRNAFIAEPGFSIISADYSQIELRIIASLSQDENMIETFQQGLDIHTATAAKICGVPLDKVTKQQRRQAKTINFGVMYGMGVYGLAEAAEISNIEAKKFLQQYFTIYSRVKEYMEEIKQLARDKGFTETWFGRKRYFPEINSGVQNIRAAAERMAINHPIQGTAADLMKLAMIAVYDGLPKISSRSKLLLQVHDELVLEVPTNEVAKVAVFIKKAMEQVVTLRVPIEVEVEAGASWGQGKILDL